MIIDNIENFKLINIEYRKTIYDKYFNKMPENSDNVVKLEEDELTYMLNDGLSDKFKTKKAKKNNVITMDDLSKTNCQTTNVNITHLSQKINPANNNELARGIYSITDPRYPLNDIDGKLLRFVNELDT